MANKHYESQVTFTPSIKQGISGAQKIEINPNVSIFKEIDGRELLYGITVFGNTVLLKPETAQKIIISLNSLIKNKDLDQKLESKIKSKVIQMNPG